jgi:hypothetical protein
MHIPSADGTYESLAAARLQREYHQDATSVFGLTDRLEPLLSLGVSRIGKNGDRSPEDALNRGKRDAVLFAFEPIRPIPLKPGGRETRNVVCTFVLSFVNRWA